MKTRVAAVLLATVVVRVSAMPSVPERLSETGLYRPDTRTLDSRVHPFAPQYPLWTDGAAKARWMRLPDKGRIDARVADRWEFPVGTRFWKEFSFGGRKVETRMLWRSSASDWTYATYVWNEAQTDATLAPEEGLLDVVQLAPGKRHSIPSRTDCRACHDNGGTPVLGFTALQLSDDRDPLAPHAEPLQPGMNTLQTLIRQGLLDFPDPALAAEAPRIPGPARTRAALGYLSANCGHCHNEHSSVASVRFPLSMPAYPTPARVNDTLTTLIARTTRWDLPHSTPGTTRVIAPGAADLSAMVARMRSRRPSSQMPPLGTVLPDLEALDLMSSWIAELQTMPSAATPPAISSVDATSR